VGEEGEAMADDPDGRKPDALDRAASGTAAGDDDEKKKARAARIAALASVAELNKKHFVVSNIGGKCMVGEFVPSPIDENCSLLSLQAPSPFAVRYGNQKVGVVEEEEDGSISYSYRELGRYWLKHRDRRGYEGIELVTH
jgi:hypothetical protein